MRKSSPTRFARTGSSCGRSTSVLAALLSAGNTANDRIHQLWRRASACSMRYCTVQTLQWKPSAVEGAQRHPVLHHPHPPQPTTSLFSAAILVRVACARLQPFSYDTQPLLFTIGQPNRNKLAFDPIPVRLDGAPDPDKYVSIRRGSLNAPHTPRYLSSILPHLLPSLMYTPSPPPLPHLAYPY